MKKLKIVQCSDSFLWYANHVGAVVPFLREEDHEYISRDASGYTNIIKKQDAVVIDEQWGCHE